MLGLAGALLNVFEYDSQITALMFSGLESMALVSEAMPILLADPATKSLGIAISETQKSLMFAQLGRRDAMVAAARKAIEAAQEGVVEGNPFVTAIESLCVVFFLHAEQFKEADELLRKLVKFNPHSFGTFTYNNLAWLRASCPDPQFRDGAQAVEFATKACEQSHWREAFTVAGLAAAYAEKGNFEEAIRWQTKAIELSPTEKQKQEGHRRLELFKAGEPFRISTKWRDGRESQFKSSTQNH